MKNITQQIIVILFLILINNKLLALESKEDRARNCARFRQIILELERDLSAQEIFRDDYKKKWIHPVNLPWNFESQLTERKSQIIKDLIYYNDKLSTNYCTQSSWPHIQKENS